MKPSERRLKLWNELHQWESIELPAVATVQLLFRDVTLNSWCGAAGVDFKINKRPDPEFHSETTIIFSLKKETIEPYEDLDDDEL